MSQSHQLKPADKVEILSLIDNSLDYLSSIEKKEVQPSRNWVRAEHGLSMLVRVFSANKAHSILFDTGLTPEGAVANAEKLEVHLSEIEAIVLSHSHPDHAGGLVSVVKAVNKQDLPVIVHEDMFKTRGMMKADGTIRKHQAFPSEAQVKPARYVKTSQPYLLAGNMVLVTGEIPRKTSFETGLPEHRALVDGQWVPEPWLRDDRALIINVKQKGLIVLTGCGHAGIVNTVLHAKELTGTEEVYAVMGGFHLAGKEHEKRIDQTVAELKRFNPKIIAPSHCTGWRGLFAIQQAMPEAFVWNSVGNLYRIE